MHYILLALREPLHGYAMMQKIEEMSEGSVRIAAGTMYGAIENFPFAIMRFIPPWLFLATCSMYVVMYFRYRKSIQQFIE
ncbi:PadR family transcriptional regulator [Lysinibacillus sp. FJAT-14745]|uniref:PadR family transcriptional regulator n=1 Tax=Lysinibacillus sp. FJAT-14745 TaxID=1704289 RepID=UPI003511466E